MCGCNLIFDPENQATKSLRREQSSTHFADEIFYKIAITEQGVVTYMSPVEAFATAISFLRFLTRLTCGVVWKPQLHPSLWLSGPRANNYIISC